MENEELNDDARAIYKSRFDHQQSSEFYNHRDNLEVKCFTDILGRFFLLTHSTTQTNITNDTFKADRLTLVFSC